MSATYIPQAGGIPHRVLSYFEHNPDDSLTAEDISVKFDAKVASVRNTLRPAVQAGMLALEEQDGESVYVLAKPAKQRPVAPYITAVVPRPSKPAAITATAPAKPPAAGFRQYPTPAEIEALPIRKGTLPQAPRRIGGKWDALFDRVTEPGLLLEIPRAWHEAVSSEARKRNKRGQVPDGHRWACRLISLKNAAIAMEPLK